MPKYYCEYCDIYLTHSSPVGRRQHTLGRKHINAKIEYFQNLIREEGITAQNFLGFLHVNSNMYGPPGMSPMMNYMHPGSHQPMNMYMKPGFSKTAMYSMRGGYGHTPFHNTFPNNKYQRPGTYYPPSYQKNPNQIQNQNQNQMVATTTASASGISSTNTITATPTNPTNNLTPPSHFVPIPQNSKFGAYPHTTAYNHFNMKNNPPINAYNGNPNLIQIPPRNIPPMGNTSPPTVANENNNHDLTNSVEGNNN